MEICLEAISVPYKRSLIPHTVCTRIRFQLYITEMALGDPESLLVDLLLLFGRGDRGWGPGGGRGQRRRRSS